jgi:hypothetical protein
MEVVGRCVPLCDPPPKCSAWGNIVSEHYALPKGLSAIGFSAGVVFHLLVRNADLSAVQQGTRSDDNHAGPLCADTTDSAAQ